MGEKATIESTIEYIDKLINGTVDELDDNADEQNPNDVAQTEQQTAPKPLTEEERAQKLLRLEEIRKQKAKEREGIARMSGPCLIWHQT